MDPTATLYTFHFMRDLADLIARLSGLALRLRYPNGRGYWLTWAVLGVPRVWRVVVQSNLKVFPSLMK
ncbi:hypothetical protein PspLS_00330 [Pyricularia sp. CBS 133598]|nr:hypothetical protein PspLS_00330 [Pyricularia sp. CBS 133598]